MMNAQKNTLLAAFVLLASVTLAGCGTTAPGPSATPSGAASETPSSSPTHTDLVAAVTCDTILSPFGYSDLAADNLLPKEFTGWHTDLQFFLDNGTVCKWGNQGDVMVIVAQAPITEEAWTAMQSDLLAQGFTQTDTPALGFVNEPDTDPNYIDGGFIFRDGQLYYVSYSNGLGLLPAFQA